jgi:3-hydroxyisobutyrate dehydrogenase-like beta-hydroxyacid dehydrogenase
MSFGAPAAGYVSLDEFVAANDAIIVSLWGDEVAHEVTLRRILPAMRRSQVLIEMSTLSPQMYGTLESAAQTRKIGFVASPIVGNPDVVREGAAKVLVGGAQEAVEQVRDVLSSLGTIVRMDSVEASGYLKLANNILLGVIAETLDELLELSARAGIDFEAAVRLLLGTMQRTAEQKLPQLLARDSEPRFSLGALLKDLHLASKAATALQVPLPVLEAALPRAERAAASGLENRDYIALALEGTGALSKVS